MKKLMLVLAMAVFAVCSGLAQDFGPLIFNHQIAIGMTFGNVQASWGRPEKVDRSVFSNGVTEYWSFKNGSLVVFENGRVVSYHQ
ncbi:MAG: hypothetical protein M3Y27_23575 [Acidobacteriota bacterium]|nr:hypothetical protein [Acidobacteriota bacterium]